MLLSPPFEHQPNYLKEEPKTQGSPPDPPEDSTPQPIPTAHTRGPRHKRPAPSPFLHRVPCPFLWYPQAMERCPGRRHSGPFHPPPRPRLGGRLACELTLYQARGGGPARPGDRDSLSEVGTVSELTPYQAREPLGRLDPPGGTTQTWTILRLQGAHSPDHWTSLLAALMRCGQPHGGGVGPAGPIGPRPSPVFIRAKGRISGKSGQDALAPEPRSSPTSAQKLGAKPTNQRLPSPTTQTEQSKPHPPHN